MLAHFIWCKPEGHKSVKKCIIQFAFTHRSVIEETLTGPAFGFVEHNTMTHSLLNKTLLQVRRSRVSPI